MSFASAAVAADQWTDADTFYAARENNRANIAEARSRYVTILSAATTNADKLRAASQLGRLAIYEGEMVLPKDNTTERKAIFRDCWDNFAEKINPTAVGENAAYYYFKGVCLAYWGEAAGPLASLPHVPTLNRMIEGGVRVDERFEGAGVHRLAAGVYSNRAARGVGLYQPERAVNHAERMVTLPAFPGDPSSGAEYYDNWRGLGLVYEEVGRVEDAKSTLEEKIAELEELVLANTLPAGRGPEAKWNLSQMQEQLARLSQ